MRAEKRKQVDRSARPAARARFDQEQEPTRPSRRSSRACPEDPLCYTARIMTSRYVFPGASQGLPAPDDRLVAPGSRAEILEGRLLLAPPAEEGHAIPHAKLVDRPASRTENLAQGSNIRQ
jgi:hypothetical protein